MRRVLAVAALVAAFVFLAPVIASAHDWYTGARDPRTGTRCCGGNDCAVLELEPGVLTGEPNGYRLRLTVAQAQKINPYRVEPVDTVIPWERVQESPDGRFHLCLSHVRGSARDDFYCFFAPPNT